MTESPEAEISTQQDISRYSSLFITKDIAVRVLSSGTRLAVASGTTAPVKKLSSISEFGLAVGSIRPWAPFQNGEVRSFVRLECFI